MSMEMTALDSETSIYTATIISLGVATIDRDAEGYVRNDGANRGISMGLDTRGEWLLYMTTNGDPSLLCDDLAAATDWCHDMGDCGDSDRVRILAGAHRLRNAVLTAESILGTCNDAIVESLDWYRDQANRVQANQG